MIGLIIAIVVFNVIAFKTNKILTGNQIMQVWTFSIAFQSIFDVLVEFKYHAYDYFGKGIDWVGLLPHIFLIPPVNMMFLNWFPYKSHFFKKMYYLILFTIAILIYEWVTLIPEPWGYFHYHWWTIWHSMIVDPLILLILLTFFKIQSNLENEKIKKSKKDDL